MTAPMLSLSSESYQNSIFCGFSRLQGNQEFVDLTLAADGHLVKVHKNIIALASPYLKEMIQSLSSDNPVIFLNNVHNSMLRLLLEYIYQGQVNIPQESLASFLEVAKSLHIIGISNNNSKPEQKLNAAVDQFIQPHKQARKTIPLIPHSTSVTKPNIVPQSSNVPQFKPLEETAKLVQPETDTFPSQGVTNIEVLTNKEVLGSSLVEDMPIYTIDTDEDPQEAASAEKTAAMTSFTESVAPSQTEFNYKSDIEMQTNYAASITISGDRNFEVQQFENMQLLTSDGATTNENNDQIIAKAICQENMPDLENMDYAPSQGINRDQNNCFTIQPVQSDSNTAELNAVSKLSLKQPVMLPTIQLNEEVKAALCFINQFTISERGKLQIIVNKYIYASHHNSNNGRKHRWRCLDYRTLRCPAYIDSFDNRIVGRKGAHNHNYHIDRILKKMQRNLVYHTIQQATIAAVRRKNFTDIQCDIEDIFSE